MRADPAENCCAPNQPYQSERCPTQRPRPAASFPKDPPPEKTSPSRTQPSPHQPVKGNPDRQDPPRKPPSPIDPRHDQERPGDAMRARFLAFMPELRESLVAWVDESLIDDVVQEAWIKVEQWADKAAAHPKPEAAFVMIASNIVKTGLRKTKGQTTISLIDQDMAVSTPAEPEEVRPELLIDPALVRRAVEQIPAEYQTVIHAAFWEGLGGRGAWRVHRIPDANFRRWLPLALQCLREILQQP